MSIYKNGDIVDPYSSEQVAKFPRILSLGGFWQPERAVVQTDFKGLFRYNVIGFVKLIGRNVQKIDLVLLH